MEIKSTRDAYGEALIEMGKVYPNLFVMDADLSSSTKTCYFARAFPDRFFNAGIAEQNMVGVAGGLSKTGKIVIISTLAVFAPGRVYDQIRNTVVHSNCNVKIVSTHAGISVGKDGSSHQSIEDIALMRVIPGMKVFVPVDAIETKNIIKAILQFHGPCYVRLGRAETPQITKKNSSFEPGKGIVLRTGEDITIISCGMMVFEALKTYDLLFNEGIQAEIINMPSVKPIDADLTTRSAKKTGIVLTCEEHSIIGGLGSAVLETLEEQTGVTIKRIGMMDCFGESGLPEELFDKYGLSAYSIFTQAKELVLRMEKK